MGFKTFNAGDVLTASDVNTYLMKQGVIVCTSGTRPSSPVEGMTIAETDTNKLLTYDGSTWRTVSYFGDGETFTPAFTATTSNPTMGNSVVHGRYWRNGPNRVDVMIWIKLGSTFTVGSGAYSVNLPVAVSATRDRWHLSMSYYDSSAAAFYRGYAWAGEEGAGVANSTAARLLLDFGSTAGLTQGVTNAAPVVPGQSDIYAITGTYYA